MHNNEVELIDAAAPKAHFGRWKQEKMKLYPKRKSETEYISWIRKQVSHAKRLAVFHGIMFIVSIVLFLVFNHLVFQFHEIMPEAAATLPLGVIIGLPFGVMLVFLLAMVAFNVVTAVRHLSGNRTEKLMLKFHDELKEKRGLPTKKSTLSSEGAPSDER